MSKHSRSGRIGSTARQIARRSPRHPWHGAWASRAWSSADCSHASRRRARSRVASTADRPGNVALTSANNSSTVAGTDILRFRRHAGRHGERLRRRRHHGGRHAGTVPTGTTTITVTTNGSITLAGRLAYLHGHADRYFRRRQRQFAGEHAVQVFAGLTLTRDRRVGHGRPGVHLHGDNQCPQRRYGDHRAGATLLHRHDLRLRRRTPSPAGRPRPPWWALRSRSR